MADFGTEHSDLLEMAGAEFQDLYNSVDWEGLRMYSYIAKTIDNDTWGFDLLKSADGENFELVTDSGFNDRYNYGGRSIMATDYGLFVGTANPFYGTQLWKITDGTEEIPDPDPENPDPENPDPENPDPENPGTEDPDPENPGTEDPDPENPNDDQIQDQWQDQLEDPDQLINGLDDLNNNLNLNNGQTSTSGNQQYSSLAQTKLPAAGNNHLFIGIGIGTIGIVLVSAYKFLRYRNIDKH